MKNLFIVLLAAGTVSSNVFAGIEAKVATCTACHGQNGISNSPLWPNLAGQKKDYLAKQLNAFKAGTRLDPVMAPMASQLSDSEIIEISQYFSTLTDAGKK